MADTPAANGAQDDPMPSLNALAQYTKDFSFENPNAPRSLTPQQNGPQISIQVNVNAKQIAEADFEVDLTLEGDAKTGEEVLFAFELTYAGIFRVRNIPQDQLHPVIMIECPRLLFPFARQMVATRCATAASRPSTSTRSTSWPSTARRRWKAARPTSRWPEGPGRPSPSPGRGPLRDRRGRA
jgi:preprotein translocase subunit SecB